VEFVDAVKVESGVLMLLEDLFGQKMSVFMGVLSISSLLA
jgi:hypothetical protein